VAKTGCQYSTQHLPIEVAAKAIERNLADDPASERARRLREMYGTVHGVTSLENCVDLISGTAPSGPRYFEGRGQDTQEVKIGPAITGTANAS
jgi:hypothetical protein